MRIHLQDWLYHSYGIICYRTLITVYRNIQPAVCPSLITKMRYKVVYGWGGWVVDGPQYTVR